VESAAELKASPWPAGRGIIGLSAGASTPDSDIAGIEAALLL
jgi:4-hydroxy-3-methylbut-2-enyl diphosphate reductase IspH